MNSVDSFIDRIKNNFSKISEPKYKNLVKILSYIWKNTKKILNCKKSDDVCFEFFLDHVFHPKRTPAKRLSYIHDFPTMEDLKKLMEYDPDLIHELEKLKIISLFKFPDKTNILLNPEGYGLLKSLEQREPVDNKYSPNGFFLRSFEKLLINYYRDLIFEKIENLIPKKEISTLSLKEIGVLLFFFLNNSFSTETAFIRKNLEVNRSINCIATAFKQGYALTEEQRDTLNLRVLERDISTIQQKIDFGLYNEQSKYYIKPEMRDKIFNLIISSLKDKKTFIRNWQGLKEEYQFWRPVLESNEICFFKKTNEIELENKIKDFLKLDEDSLKKKLKKIKETEFDKKSEIPIIEGPTKEELEKKRKRLILERELEQEK
ncbi:MAG: hypothetical protein ACTSR3_22870 [Candidatus Helarchaeota archaeon]